MSWGIAPPGSFTFLTSNPGTVYLDPSPKFISASGGCEDLFRDKSQTLLNRAAFLKYHPQNSKIVHLYNSHVHSLPPRGLFPFFQCIQVGRTDPLITGRAVPLPGPRISHGRSKPVMQIPLPLAMDYSEFGHLTQFWPVGCKGKSGDLERRDFAIKRAVLAL